MKKLLYLIPLLLIVLNVLPFSLYKDTIKLNTIDSLTPSHWQIASENMSFSGSLGSITPGSNAQAAQSVNLATYVSIGATFRGFPFGAYFSRSVGSNSHGGSSNFDISGYSVLWIFVDGLLVLITILATFLINKKQRVSPTANLSPPSNPSNGIQPQPIYQPNVNASIIKPSQPTMPVSPTNPVIAQQPLQITQPDVPQPQVITPTQPQQPIPQVGDSNEEH